MRNYTLAFFYILLLSAGLSAQQATFTATTDAKQVTQNGYVDVSFTLENVEGKNFKPPVFTNFKVASGPSQSSQMTIVNGRVSRKITYSYSLIATKLGKTTIGPASIRAGSKSLRTKPIMIEVVKGKPTPKSADGSDAKDIFVQLELSDSTVYIGQQITAKYMLYTQQDVSSADFRAEPNYEGFYAKRVRNLNDRASRVIIDGVQYTKKALRTMAIFPQQKGTFTFDPVPINLGLPVKDGRRNSFFFSTRTKPYATTTAAVTVKVLSTPPNAPSSFSGAIGKYTMTASIDKSSISTDDALTMKMHIRGVGDGKFVEAPLQTNAAFDIYDPNVIQDESTERGDQIRVDKVFEYLMVPNQKGTFYVRPEFTYFDIDSNEYRTLYAQNNRVNVVQGSGSRAALNIDKDDLGELMPVISSSALGKRGSHFFGSPIHLTLVGFPFLSLLGLVFYKRKLIKEAAIDPTLKRQSAARLMAMRRLESASEAKNKGDQRLFYEEINNGIYGYISDKYLVAPADLNQAHIEQVLVRENVHSDQISLFKDVIKTCQQALYASTQAEDMSDVYNQAVQLIAEIEGE